MKNILITGGPTIEPIDEVMKITNFSTGSLAVNLTRYFLDNGYEVTLVANHIVNTENIEKRAGLTLEKVETTEEMMDRIEVSSTEREYVALLHTAAVGDYKSDFTFLLEDMAKEIDKAYKDGKISGPDDILTLMEDPECKLDDSSKISSYQKNLTVKLTLTQKIISKLREWFPDTLLVGCKLLENVSKDELFEVAQKLCKKNDMDYILANDLAELSKGIKTRFLVNKEGFTGTELESPKDIFDLINSKFN